MTDDITCLHHFPLLCMLWFAYFRTCATYFAYFSAYFVQFQRFFHIFCIKMAHILREISVLHRDLVAHIISHCSTVVRNTFVRATIKVNGKPQTLGTYSPQTPESIDLKFNLGDYIGHVTLPAKDGTNRPSRAGGAKG